MFDAGLLDHSETWHKAQSDDRPKRCQTTQPTGSAAKLRGFVIGSSRRATRLGHTGSPTANRSLDVNSWNAGDWLATVTHRQLCRLNPPQFHASPIAVPPKVA